MTENAIPVEKGSLGARTPSTEIEYFERLKLLVLKLFDRDSTPKTTD